jgi:cellobiose phosphorylase
VEPYVACADVYSVEPHVGRGGWTWYTGSAGWLYRAELEAILGFRVRGKLLAIDPRLPRAWPGFAIVFRRRGPKDRITRYDIAVENPDHVSHGVVRTELDDVTIADGAAPFRSRTTAAGTGCSSCSATDAHERFLRSDPDHALLQLRVPVAPGAQRHRDPRRTSEALLE